MPIAGHKNCSMLLLVTILFCFSSASSHASSLPTSSVHNSSETDRQALLCLRSYLSDPAGSLVSWRNDSLSFCDWQGVSCSKHNVPRVVALDLASLNITGKLSPSLGNLHFINTIDMARNQINGSIPPEIGNLTRLRYLNLSMNSITGVIPDSISLCTNLQVIRLMNNSIEGEIPESLAKLQFLQEITLSNNNLRGTIPSGIGLLPNLKFLFLPSNNIKGSIPEFLGSSPSLSMVVVRNNSLSGGIPPMLANSSSLYYLDLMRNNFTGIIPPGLFSSISLRSIDLSYNSFFGSIPSPTLISSPLQYISLTSNNISGAIPATLGKFSSLVTLLLAQNNLQGVIPENLAAIPGLQVVDMSYNNLSGMVPQMIFNMTSLTYLGLGLNQLVGRIPSGIGYNLPKLQKLVLEGNNFSGPLPESLVHASMLQELDLRDNAFSGVIPSYWTLPNLIELDLGANNLETVDWSSLSSATSSTTLQILYLDSNNIQGPLPNSIGYLSRSLQQLFLTDNNFSGTIPSEIGNLANLTVLQLEGNMFSGSIPETLGNLSSLFVLSLAKNKLSGNIPESIGNLERLSELYLQENNLRGLIPPSIERCNILVMLNLSHNFFQGSIPPELFSISSLSIGLDLSYNRLSGSIPSNIGGLINLGNLDISNNNLSGEIPHTLGDCLHLESIHLEVNFLSGSIPLSFTSLRGISNMDLSQNNLSGEIPNFLETFSTLQLINLSFNNLEGVVPTGGAFCNSSKVFLQGNKMLCARDPMLQLPVCMLTALKRKKTLLVILIAIPVVSVVFIITACAAIFLFKKRSHLKSHVNKPFKGLKKFSYSDVAKATNEFSSDNLVGTGRFGFVYKGIFKFEEFPVAVKVFKLDQFGAPKNFFAECEVLRSTRHRNLIRVISLCSSIDQMGNEFKALILEYMDNGSLDRWIHSKSDTSKKTMPLSIGLRIMISIDIAAALDYLHNWCTPPLVHCDLKPSNVLLDDDMVAHVSDFGLAKFLHNYSSMRLYSSRNIVGPRGSIGYIAPEYGMGCEISTAGDIYSYGIILLEMLTGKRPTDEMFKDGLNLHKFVEQAFPDNVCEIWDTYNKASHNNGYENQTMVGIEACVKRLAELGLRCSVDTPTDRPAIQDVYAEIIAIGETVSELEH